MWGAKWTRDLGWERKQKQSEVQIGEERARHQLGAVMIGFWAFTARDDLIDLIWLIDWLEIYWRIPSRPPSSCRLQLALLSIVAGERRERGISSGEKKYRNGSTSKDNVAVHISYGTGFTILIRVS